MNALLGQMELTPTDIASALTNEQLISHQLHAIASSFVPETACQQWLLPSKRNDSQLELATVIAHEPPKPQQDNHKPAGIRLAKMLSQYDDSPSSQLWGDIQRLAREILK